MRARARVRVGVGVRMRARMRARMMRVLFYIVVFSLIFNGCVKDKVVYQVTPYNLNIPDHFPQMQIPDDNPMTKEGVELGRKLFYETRLSRDNSISCSSCHLPENGFSDPNKFSIGVDGAIGRRQSMALVNLGWQQFFFWDGRAQTLEDQIFEPIRDPVEMDFNWLDAVSRLKQDVDYRNMFYKAFDVEEFDSTHVSKAIAQFLRTMISSRSKYDVMYKERSDIPLNNWEKDVINNEVTQQEWNGFDLFFSLLGGDCLHCHDGALMQVNLFSNNGLDATFEDDLGRYEVTGNPMDKGRFKAPTLRNIELTAPYMHDGRFTTLEEVVAHYSFGVIESETIDPMMEFSHQGGVQLDPEEQAQLVAFLKTLTDWDFINNPKFQPPKH